MHRSEFHYAWSHEEADNELTSPEVKPQTGLSSLRVSCKCALRPTIEAFNWQRTFLNTSVNGKADIVNRTILNIISKLIPQETAESYDKDALWVTNTINFWIHEKKKQYSQNISKNTKGLSHQKNIGKPASRLTSTHKRSKAYQQLLKISSNKMKNIVYNSVTPREYFYNRFQRKCELILSFSKQSNEEV